MNSEQPDITHASRRLAGISALRKLRRLVDEENAQEHQKARWALRIGVIFAVAVGVFVIRLLNLRG
jgi:hypothetical protein